MVTTKLSMANALNSQILSILNGENNTTPVFRHKNGNDYYTLMTMPFNAVDTDYYKNSWQNYRYAIMFNPLNNELLLVSMLGLEDWGNTHRYIEIDSKDPSDDIWYILTVYTELGKQYYDCLDNDCVYEQNKYRGLGRIDYIWHGSQADPELIYDGESFCYWDVEDALWDTFIEEVNNKEVHYVTGKPVDEHFQKWIQENETRVYDMLDAWVYNLRVEV